MTAYEAKFELICKIVEMVSRADFDKCNSFTDSTIELSDGQEFTVNITRDSAGNSVCRKEDDYDLRTSDWKEIPPYGTYEAIWSGFFVKFQHNGILWVITTQIGTRSLNHKCKVVVSPFDIRCHDQDGSIPIKSITGKAV